MTTRGKGFLMAFPILAVIGLLWLAYFYFTLSSAQAGAPTTAAEPVLIQRGEGLQDIAAKLFSGGYIRSESSFKFYSLITGIGHQLKPGLYNISAGSSTPDIIKLLVAGPSKEIEVLITEGESMAEIDARLAKLGIITAGDFMHLKPDALRLKYPFLAGARSLEGYLFPDTYRFFFDSSPEAAAAHFLDNYAAKVAPLIADGDTVDYDSIPITRRGIYSINEITSIASMLEKEVPTTEDRKLVADILYRRLKMGMALQIDASTDYAKQAGDPRYDTYQFAGMPPGPISNPGLDAIDAALNPKPNQFLYYLSDPRTQKTIFAKTFDEHKANKLKYLP